MMHKGSIQHEDGNYQAPAGSTVKGLMVANPQIAAKPDKGSIHAEIGGWMRKETASNTLLTP
jgi:hypothetical protein